ncbi:hypothetical protein FUAX_54510 (plasmid) [Fulvitalea axinellae]|uniref:ParB-like N-terminal domain-containing protein n=1 Tax=Fulvitalea axinellae TaxID=1182444 RepID=A0AAU9CM39_9BACT|nr:hypothetical protein FUAX_54510 [Fulvitalea axinellae]
MAKKFGSVIRHKRNRGEELGATQAIKSKIKVLEELRSLIPPLRDEEYLQLLDNVRKEGVREPILLWECGEDYVIVDGHNRYRCVEELGREEVRWHVKVGDFGNIEDVRAWMIDNQLGRRNLTDLQRAVLIEEKYDLIKQGRGGDRRTKTNGQNLPIENNERQNAYQVIAKETGRSERTVKNDIAVARGLKVLPEEEREQILKGEKKAKKGDLAKLGRGQAPATKVVKAEAKPGAKVTAGVWLIESEGRREMVRVRAGKVERWGRSGKVSLEEFSQGVSFLEKVDLRKV